MKHKTSQPFLLYKHSVISCAIAKGGALRERQNVRLGTLPAVRWVAPEQVPTLAQIVALAMAANDSDVCDVAVFERRFVQR